LAVVPSALGAFACSSSADDGDSQESAIVGGTTASRSVFPATVGLGTFEGKLVCTATRIGPSAYLTAAHCLVDKTTGRVKPMFAKGSYVTLFKGDAIDAVFENQMQPEVTGVALAPARGIDVGILFVKHRGNEHRAVRIAEIATDARARVAPGQDLVVQGYGCASLANDDGSRRLRRATVKAGDDGVFAHYQGESARAEFETYVPIDVARTNGPSICFGDSGGASYAAESNAAAPHVKVVGVASAVDAPGLAWGDPTIRFAKLARIDDGGRFAIGTWLRESATAGSSRPLGDKTANAKLAAHAFLVVQNETENGHYLPLADVRGARVRVEFEEAECRLHIRALRLARGGQASAVTASEDGSFAVPRASAAYDGLEIDLGFPDFHPVDDEAEVCTLRVRAL
jgi:hypothetical protein